MKIDNISIEEYFSLQDTSEYDVFIKTLRPKNLFCGKVADYNRLTFDEVEAIKSVLRAPNLEDVRDLFIMLYDIKPRFYRSAERAFLREKVFTLFAAQAYLEQWITRVIDRENKQLSGEPDEKWLRVNGSERLAPVSHLLTKKRLAESFATGDPDIIGGWKYSKVFTILVAEKRYNDVMKDYNEIK